MSHFPRIQRSFFNHLHPTFQLILDGSNNFELATKWATCTVFSIQSLTKIVHVPVYEGTTPAASVSIPFLFISEMPSLIATVILLLNSQSFCYAQQ